MDKFNFTEKRMINQQIKDMMRRDNHFRERMEELGYVDQPIIAVVDWEQETLFTQTNQFRFDTLDNDYLNLLRSTRMDIKTKRTPMSERAVALTNELVEHTPDIPYKKEQKNLSRDVFQSIFMYEMLLMHELEEQLELSEDEKLHLVGQNQLTKGSDYMGKKLNKMITPKKGPELTL